MHASQVSSSGASAYQPPYQPGHSERRARGADGVRSTEAVERRGENHRHHRGGDVDRAERSDDSRPARNPLVSAMMEALKGLTQGAGKATDSASADAATPSPTKDVSTTSSQGGDAPKSVKEAALNFANELYNALRAAGESSGVAAPKKTGYGDSGGGYGDLAQGLKRLAQGISAPAPAPAPASAAAPAPTPVSAAAPTPVSAPVSAPAAAPVTPTVPPPVAAPAPKPSVANPETPKPAAPAPSVVPTNAASSSRSPITINITFNFVNSTTIGASRASSGSTTNSSTSSAPDADKSAASTEAPADSPLLKAFKDLMAALNGDPAEGGAAIDNDKAVQMLQSFLQKIAESLGGDASAQAAEASLPAKGSLISVTA